MNERKLATTEQKAWLKAKGDYTCPFARFWCDSDGKGLLRKNHKGWDAFYAGEISQQEGNGLKLCYKITDPELAKAEGFPMGEAATESFAMRMASDRAEQATMQIKSMYDIQNEQAKAQADAEILVKSAIGETVANNADYELMSSAPALLARVRELEEFIDCELCEYIEELRREMLRAVHVDSDVRDIRYATELANKDVLADIKKDWL